MLRSIESRVLRRLPRGAFWDQLYAKMLFRLAQGRNPKPDAPLFNDHLYKLKVSGELDEPWRVFVTDKEFVKQFVKETIGDEYNVPTIAVLNTPDEVRRYSFPERCCIKATHGSGQTVIRKGGEPIDIEKVVGWFSHCHYRATAERNYRTLQHKVIVEPLIFDSATVEDYKIFCVGGAPKLVQVDVDRHTNHTRKLYTCDWVDTGCSIGFPMYPGDVPRPRNLDHMLKLAGALSRKFSSIRVDLYTDSDRVYVGELTNCHGGATERFNPPEGEAKISRMCFG